MARIEKENVTVPVVVQSVGGDLRLRGRNGNRLIADGDNVQVDQVGEGHPCVINCAGDCRLTVPQNVDVSLQHVGGDAKLTDLGGKIEIGTVGGDLTLRDVASVQIKTIGGDLRIKFAEGDIKTGAVGSDATIRQVSGSVRIDTIGADGYLRDVQGDCVVHQAGSDLVLNMDFAPAHEYHFKVGGDILCRVQPDTSARFIIPASMSVQLDVEAEVTELEETGQQVITLGDGGALINITGGEELRLIGEEEEYVLDLGIQIEEELVDRLSSLEEKLNEQLEGLDERIQAQTEHWASRAEHIAEQAQHQALKAAEQLRRNMARAAKPKRTRPPKTPRAAIRFGKPPQPPVDPVSEEERLMILQMVKDNKITIEEAERLLAALEG
ncbi:MAG: hypothetical protein JXJ20_13870 [Anaerolineae bacterium]|nr:hypothetical protein [Anaerolineae bacterium]